MGQDRRKFIPKYPDDNNRDFPAPETCLMLNISIDRQHHLEASKLSCCQELAVYKAFQSGVSDRNALMVIGCKSTGEALIQHLIEEQFHLSK